MLTRLFVLLFLFFPLGGVSAQTTVSIGQSAPALLLEELGGDNWIDLEEYQGKVVYLDFWASWCVPCLQSFPALSELYARYNEDGFEVIAVNLDEHIDAAMQFANRYPTDYPLVAGFGTDVPQSYQVEVMPTAYFIDREGVVRLVHHGFKTEHVEFLEAWLQKLLAER